MKKSVSRDESYSRIFCEFYSLACLEINFRFEKLFSNSIVSWSDRIDKSIMFTAMNNSIESYNKSI